MNDRIEQAAKKIEATPTPWDFTYFTRPNDEPITTVEHVIEALTRSARDGGGFLWGVTSPVEKDGEGLYKVICYTGNGPASEENARLIANAVNARHLSSNQWEVKFHRVMQLLRNTKMEHGLCQPRSRKACTHCNAADEIDTMLSEYKGARIVASAPPSATTQLPEFLKAPDWPKHCNLCDTMMTSPDDRMEWHGLGNCVEVSQKGKPPYSAIDAIVTEVFCWPWPPKAQKLYAAICDLFDSTSTQLGVEK